MDDSTNSKFLQDFFAPGPSCGSHAAFVAVPAPITFLPSATGLQEVTTTEISVNFRQAVFIKDAPWIWARRLSGIFRAESVDLRCVNHVLVDVLRQPKNNEMKEGSVSYILNPNDLPKKLFPILGDGNIYK